MSKSRNQSQAAGDSFTSVDWDTTTGCDSPAADEMRAIRVDLLRFQTCDSISL